MKSIIKDVPKKPSHFKSIEAAIEFHYGSLERWPMEPDGINPSQPHIIAVCTRIFETGECLWHAQSVIKAASYCPCADCSPSLGMVSRKRPGA